MAAFPKPRFGFGRTTTNDEVTPVAMTTVEGDKKDPAIGSPDDTAADQSNEKPPLELPSQDAQRGVQNVEAVTLTWSKNSLIAVFILYVLF